MAGPTYPKSNRSPKLKRYNRKYKELSLRVPDGKVEKIYTPEEVEMENAMTSSNPPPGWRLTTTPEGYHRWVKPLPRAEAKFESMPSFKTSELRRKKK